MTTAGTWAARALMARRVATLGPHSPTFYEEPLHVVSGAGVWLRGADGVEYLDAYNNVPHVGHCIAQTSPYSRLSTPALASAGPGGPHSPANQQGSRQK
jgi:hypothetical protein